MRLPYAQITDDNIRQADSIQAINPLNGATRPVFGPSSGLQVKLFPRTSPDNHTLEVELDGDAEAAYHHLSERVAAIKASQKDESVRELAKRHYEVEDGLTRIIRFSASADTLLPAIEPIKLLEVNENTVASGVMPLGFDAAPGAGIYFPSVIIEVTPGEFEQIQAKELSLPPGWEVRHEDIPKPLSSPGDEMATNEEWAIGYARQAAADFSTFQELQGQAHIPQCHKLQFLQMACEKLVKAHLIQGGTDPKSLQSSHA